MHVLTQPYFWDIAVYLSQFNPISWLNSVIETQLAQSLALKLQCAGMNMDWKQQAQRIFPNPVKAGVEKGPEMDLKKFCMHGRRY